MKRAFNIPADFVDDDPTIELELTPAQLEMLSRAAEAETGTPSAPQTPSPPSVARPVAEQAPVLFPEPVQQAAARPKQVPVPVLAIVRPIADPVTAGTSLTEAAPPLVPAVERPKGARASMAVRPGISRLAMGLVIVGVCAFSAVVAYLTMPVPTVTPPSPPTPAETAPVPAEPASPYAETPEIMRVLFTNPFDATEVFEFPPGTTETEAREAVADLLLKRARERLNLSLDAKAPPRRPGDPDAAAARSRLARRG